MTQTKIKGVLKTWKADRGFGFIKPDAGGQDIFIHISSLKNVDRRPIRGDVIYYQVAKDNQGKYKAINATIEGVEESHKKTGSLVRINKWLIVSAISLMIIVMISLYFYNIYQ
jgi:cold shock CspA family protein